MGIILLIAGILIITIIIKTICDRAYQRYWDGHYEEGKKPAKFDQACYDNSEALAIIFWSIIICTIMALIICSIVMIVNYIQVDSFIATNTEIYNSLIYKMESTTCRDEFGFLNKEVIDEVANWNKDLQRGKAIQNNPWIGCFYPDVYDQFELIDYTSFVPRGIK